jgi:23S rRNA (guanosine2251-2'-O)-methyltransferase
LPPQNEDLICPKCGSPIKKEIFRIPAAEPKNAHTKDLPIIEVLLDNIRSAYNVGSILRTSDAVGIHHISFAGVSPTPDEPKVRKTALGSEMLISWTQYWNAMDAIEKARNNGYQVVSLEITPDAASIFDLSPGITQYPMLFTIGNEKTGVDPKILESSDIILKIPMFGMKQSINVSTAYGIAIYFLRNISISQKQI